MQDWWENEFGPQGTLNEGKYADRSYWIATENWHNYDYALNQNYPIDLTVYNNVGGFSNGYVPMFIVVGMDRKVYYNDNPNDFKSALRLAIDEMVTEGVYVKNPVSDQILGLGNFETLNLSDVFENLSENTVSLTVESNSDASVATVGITDNILSVTANSEKDGMTTVSIKASAGEYTAVDEFKISVYDPANIFTEDFESGDFLNNPWQFGGDFNWTVDTEQYFEGSYSARSGVIRHNNTSELIIEADYPTDGILTYYSKVSSELNYDFLRFYINGVEKNKNSGEIDWNESNFIVQAGYNTFKWSYEKDGSTSAFDDCAWVDNIRFEGGIPTGIKSDFTPEKIILYQNYPNPFNPMTHIKFMLPESSEVNINIYNVSGQKVFNLFRGQKSSGIHTVKFDGSRLNSGVYYYTLETEDQYFTQKMILLK